MSKKIYKITFDLTEGYSGKGKEHSLKFAEKVIKGWMESRLRQNCPVVTGLLQSVSLFYPFAGEAPKETVTITHSAIFTGELSSPGDMLRKGSEVRSTLESLAQTIKQKLKQQSVFIVYRDENWCV